VAAALLTAPQPRSFVELSHAPGRQRRWPSGYAALGDGRIERAALRRRFARHLPPPAPGARLALALDTSPIPRPEAATVADRPLVYAPNAPAGARPVLPGWACATLVALPDPVRRRTSVPDTQHGDRDDRRPRAVGRAPPPAADAPGAGRRRPLSLQL